MRWDTQPLYASANIWKTITSELTSYWTTVWNAFKQLNYGKMQLLNWMLYAFNNNRLIQIGCFDEVMMIVWNHFYCYITTAHVPWWVKFLRGCSRQCRNNLHIDSTYLQTYTEDNVQNKHTYTQYTQCIIRHTVINTQYTQYVHVLHYVHIYTHNNMRRCNRLYRCISIN